MRVPRAVVLAVAVQLLVVAGVSAHPAPFSYFDVHLDSDRVSATLAVHVIDLAHELGIADPAELLQPSVRDREAPGLESLLAGRLHVSIDGEPSAWRVEAVEDLPDRDALRVRLAFPPRPARATFDLRTHLFPYDPNHQTFVNVYENGELRYQTILSGSRTSLAYNRASAAGTGATIRRFVDSGIHHIFIGPDHILFLVGLLLLGGSLPQLIGIVTAFTLAHSITLTLAALDVFAPSGRFVEPAIALSIVYVGADNLLVAREGRDVRAWVAFAFGLVHGFGFASVLRELDLPSHALAWSLVSFNVGVEIGQIVIVVAVASLLALVRRRSAVLGRRVAIVGSLTVVAAGVYWFVERVFFDTV